MHAVERSPGPRDRFGKHPEQNQGISTQVSHKPSWFGRVQLKCEGNFN
jgi:hypothetical protein